MKLVDNINDLLGDDIKKSVQPGAQLKIAASTFSIYGWLGNSCLEFVSPSVCVWWFGGQTRQMLQQVLVVNPAFGSESKSTITRMSQQCHSGPLE
jgi:hypothetical protein